MIFIFYWLACLFCFQIEREPQQCHCAPSFHDAPDRPRGRARVPGPYVKIVVSQECLQPSLPARTLGIKPFPTTASKSRQNKHGCSRLSDGNTTVMQLARHLPTPMLFINCRCDFNPVNKQSAADIVFRVRSDEESQSEVLSR